MGPFLGTVLLGILPEVLRAFKDYDILIYGLLLMVIVIFHAAGRYFHILSSDRNKWKIERGRTVMSDPLFWWKMSVSILAGSPRCISVILE